MHWKMYLKRDKKIYDKEITRKSPRVNYEGENFRYSFLLYKQENAVNGTSINLREKRNLSETAKNFI